MADQDERAAEDPGADAPDVLPDQEWRPVSADLSLSRPPVAGGPGNVPTGGDLRLDIGWDRFELLVLDVARRVLGLEGVRFRRYGVGGQAQHGIDLGGRHSDSTYTVLQVKQYVTFTAVDLRRAVLKFVQGRRPFGAQHLVIAVSTSAQTTQLEDELAVLRDENPDLQIDVWGAEQINEVLRDRADIVARFWTQETARTFCTGAPPPGVAAAPPNWLRLSDQVLLGPLGANDDLAQQLVEADRLRIHDPAAATTLYQSLAEALTSEGFTGHAHVMWRKQLDALDDAGHHDAAAALAAQLAVLALHEGDLHEATVLEHRLTVLVRQPSSSKDRRAAVANSDRGALEPPAAALHSATRPSAAMNRHAQLLAAAVAVAQHPLGDTSALITALRSPTPGLSAPAYQPLLVLLAGELAAADITVISSSTASNTSDDDRAVPPTTPDNNSIAARLTALDDLVTGAINQLADPGAARLDKDATLRLRMLRASYDTAEHVDLLRQARTLQLTRPRAALVLAAQARRHALSGDSDEALEHWRRAIAHALEDARTGDASGWLYAIRGVHLRYGPWTEDLDDEHLLAQALPRTTSGRLLRRVRDPEADARRAALAERPREAILAARRWLADSIVTGDWVDEQNAAELLGDLYAAHAEPERAAACYQWAGATTKLTALAAAVGDRLLPLPPAGSGPWWHQEAGLASVTTQHDLLEDNAATTVLKTALDLVARGRAGELMDSPTHNLTLQAMRTACVLASRGTSDDAEAVLDAFAGDVARDQDRSWHHDKQHVYACLAIAAHHQQLMWPALVRLFDLAEAGTYDALQTLRDDRVLTLLREPSPGLTGPTTGTARTVPNELTGQQRQLLLQRLQEMAAAGRYDAALAVCNLGGTDPAVMARAGQARDRLLDRPEPDGNHFSADARMVSDAYLVTFLGAAEQQACLGKLITITRDRREVATNRNTALIAASVLVREQDQDLKAEVHAHSRAFVDGAQDGSFLDDEMTNPHPLSAMRIDLGPASLRAGGLCLAHRSATSDDDRAWVRDRAVLMLSSDDEHLVHRAARTLFELGPDVTDDLDSNVLAGHSATIVRQLATLPAVAAPARYAQALRVLAVDRDSTVRTALAHQLHRLQARAADGSAGTSRASSSDQHLQPEDRAVIDEVLEVLSKDVRHTVRRAAAGFDI